MKNLIIIALFMLIPISAHSQIPEGTRDVINFSIAWNNDVKFKGELPDCVKMVIQDDNMLLFTGNYPMEIWHIKSFEKGQGQQAYYLLDMKTGKSYYAILREHNAMDTPFLKAVYSLSVLKSDELTEIFIISKY